MPTRLMGQQTEYTLRFTPSGATARPSHRQVYEILLRVLSRHVATSRGRRWRLDLETFVENGGAFSYEAPVEAPADGLVEGCTPECRGAGQTLLYQRAQERLLRVCLPVVERELEAIGHPGRLALLKNGRDAKGNVYGVQESHELPVADGLTLWLGRALVLGLLGPAFALSMLAWVLRRSRPPVRWLIRLSEWAGRALVAPVSLPLTWFMARYWFRGYRAASLAYFASRCVVTGAGTLSEDGRFGLSERGLSVQGVVRWAPFFPRRVVFDQLNLLEPVFTLRFLDLRRYLGLLRRRQRLQVGYADVNRADVAEFLRLGTASLVFDMVEAGLLDDAPRLAHPAVAIRTLAEDSALSAEVCIDRGRTVTALELQRFYYERARAWLQTRDVVGIEDQEVVRLWGQVLDALESDPSTLVGRVDWVSKRYLIEAAASDQPFEVQKKVDLRYHELGGGYFDMLLPRELAPRLVEPEAVRAAMRAAPEDTPAALRSRVIRDVRQQGETIYVSWDTVRIGARPWAKVVRLDEYRSR